jgi:hypothetical protein
VKTKQTTESNGEQHTKHNIRAHRRDTYNSSSFPPLQILTPEDGHIGRNMLCFEELLKTLKVLKILNVNVKN